MAPAALSQPPGHDADQHQQERRADDIAVLDEFQRSSLAAGLSEQEIEIVPAGYYIEDGYGAMMKRLQQGPPPEVVPTAK